LRKQVGGRARDLVGEKGVERQVPEKGWCFAFGETEKRFGEGGTCAGGAVRPSPKRKEKRVRMDLQNHVAASFVVGRPLGFSSNESVWGGKKGEGCKGLVQLPSCGNPYRRRGKCGL